MSEGPLGLYIHWPYCTRICPYCDFTVARAREVDEALWTDRLLTDLDHFAAMTGRRELVSIYFGGGTPSLMPPSLVARLIERADSLFDLRPDAEVTLEANPTDAEAERFTDLARAGVNRLSLGVQSFDDVQLGFLGRNHDGAAARRALDVGLAAFSRVTFDLIYALPGEGEAAWARRLGEAAEIGAGHLSLYQLTVEPGTAFARAVGRGAWSPPDEEMAARLYEVTRDVTARAGLPAYEVSNHARPGEEAVHNALYWQGADYIGIGPGAHGRIPARDGRLATAGTTSIGGYLATAAASDRYSVETLSAEDVAIEAIAGGLRPLAGMPLSRLTPGVRTAIAPVRAELVRDGLLEDRPDRLVVSPKGRLLIDAIAARLVQPL